MKKRKEKHKQKRGDLNKGAEGKGGGRRSRFSEKDKEDALKMVLSGEKKTAVAQKMGCTGEAIRLWWNKAQEEGKIPKLSEPSGQAHNDSENPLSQKSDTQVPPEQLPEISSTAPADPGHGLSAAEAEAILDYKRRHPAMGPAQIRAQLKRFKGWRISVKAIGGLLKKNGYELEHRGSRPQGFEPQRFEAPHRNALWQLDFMEARLKGLKLFILVILDDFSRFLVECKAVEKPSSEVVVDVFEQAIKLHGKPEGVYTDRGGAFMAWRNESGFQRFCEQKLIDHHVGRAYHPQGRGKVEALIRTLQKELWETVHFNDIMELEAALAAFVQRYNFFRAHMGIDGLTPADKYFGRWPEVLDQINALSRRRNDALQLKDDGLLLDDCHQEARVSVEALRLMIHEDTLEIRLFGHRVVLGKLER